MNFFFMYSSTVPVHLECFYCK